MPLPYTCLSPDEMGLGALTNIQSSVFVAVHGLVVSFLHCVRGHFHISTRIWSRFFSFTFQPNLLKNRFISSPYLSDLERYWWSSGVYGCWCGSFSRGVHNTIHFPLLPQPLPTSDSFLNVLWVSLGYIIQLSGRLSVLWLAGNLAISLFLAQLHSHLSLSSLSLFPGILRL